MHEIADTLVWLLDRQQGVQLTEMYSIYLVHFIFNAYEFLKPHYSIIH